jgi:hypothetical protein
MIEVSFKNGKQNVKISDNKIIVSAQFVKMDKYKRYKTLSILLEGVENEVLNKIVIVHMSRLFDDMLFKRVVNWELKKSRNIKYID